MSRAKFGRWLGTGVALAVLGLVLPDAAQAQDYEDLGLVTGVEWVASTQAEKASYIIGVSNMMSVEYAWQEHLNDPPTWEQTLVQDMWDALEHVTLNGAIAVVDEFYKNNEDQMYQSVLNVLWVELVEPNLPEDRKK